MTERILSISGLRGVIGNGLDPEYLTRFAAAVGTMCGGGTIVLSRDGRSTGEVVRHAVVAGLTATGCKVLDAGIATTPTCGVLVQHHQAAGGIQITASHNPIQWNGLKPFSPLGSVFDRTTGERLLHELTVVGRGLDPDGRDVEGAHEDEAGPEGIAEPRRNGQAVLGVEGELEL